MTSYRKKCYELASRLGVEIDEGLGDALSPKGYRFASNGCHTIVFRNPLDPRADDWIYLYKNLRWGLMKCDEPECDYCHEDEEVEE